MMISKVTVFCASSKHVDQAYFKLTKDIGRILASNNITTIYGGGAVGLMGELANTILDRNAKIIGIIPSFMMDVEWGHKLISDLIVVKDMHERKKRMIQNTDAVIALPGGTGTLEELMEVITLKRLGLFVKPIIILNHDKFYTPLIELFDKMVDEKFLRPEHLKMWTVINNPNELIASIKNAPQWDASKINIAPV